ncbi:helix-turn-helix domain-containing protein [Nocardia wallacei]|nr:helix-turn-helix domain-containing protein [Nocardia wallacei]
MSRKSPAVLQCVSVLRHQPRDRGVDGLRDLRGDGRPAPNATCAEVVDKIVHLRRNYHFGRGKIAMYLHRYHDVSVATVWRILRRLDMGRLPARLRCCSGWRVRI